MLKLNIKLGVLTLLVGTSLFGYTPSTSTTTTKNIVSSVTSVTDGAKKSIDEIISSVGSLTSSGSKIFSNFNMDILTKGVVGDSKLLGCLKNNFDPASLLRDKLDGICGLSASTNDFSLDFAKCYLGNDAKKLGGLDVSPFKTLCSGVSTKSVNGVIYVVDTGLKTSSSSLNERSSAKVIAKSREISPALVLANNSPELDAIITSKDVGDITYNSGKTGKEIYETDGGYIAKNAVENPNSSDNQDWRNIIRSKHNLVLKDLSLKQNGDADPSTYKLPPTPKDVINIENNQSKTISASELNYHQLMNYFLREAKNSEGKTLQEIFLAIDEDTIGKYEVKEKEAFLKFMKNNAVSKKLEEIIRAGVTLKYSSKQLIKTADKEYIADISENRAKYVSENLRTKFRYNSLIQSLKNTELKAQMMKEYNKKMEELEEFKESVYYRASIFREDISLKEINVLLNSVDTAIK